MNAISSVQSSASVSAGSGASGSYTVKSGDCLWDIAQAHGISLQALEAANPQIANPDLIYPGQQISLPGGSGAGGVTSGAAGGAAAMSRTSRAPISARTPPR